MIRAFIAGCQGTVLSREEEVFFKDMPPWGMILFKRNIETPNQVAELISRFRACVGRPDAPVLVDQEGGRVQRLGPPHWPAYPCALSFYEHYLTAPLEALRHLRHSAYSMACELATLGITIACLPVLDIPSPGAHSIIGDRAYGSDPEKSALLAGVVIAGLHQGGILPIVKHIPGHGRASVDSHHALPEVNTPRTVLERTDFLPFAIHATAPMAMTAHVVYHALDPTQCATFSPLVLTFIRKEIGFSGVLISDDLSMKALSGSLYERAQRARNAGCDLVLHCNGILEEAYHVAQGAGFWDPPSSFKR